LCEKCSCEVHRYDLDLNEAGELYPCRDIGPHLVLTVVGHWYLNHRHKVHQGTLSPQGKGR
jgi:hypothetical protein